MKVLLFDNYDSFTYNLVHIVRALGYDYEVHRNDKIALDEIARFDKIMISPGPGIPEEAGILKPMIQAYGATKSILGICLGHQAIAEVYGGTLFNIPSVLHGVTSQTTVVDHEEPLFRNIPATFQVCHYHSWAVSPDAFPAELKITATNPEGLIMGLRHTRYDVRGVQFHPESIMTPEGPKMIENWLAN